MSMFVNNALLGGGVRVREQRKIKGTTKPLMANLDITLLPQAWEHTRGLRLWQSTFPLFCQPHSMPSF